jgi:hypothetical protein
LKPQLKELKELKKVYSDFLQHSSTKLAFDVCGLLNWKRLVQIAESMSSTESELDNAMKVSWWVVE